MDAALRIPIAGAVNERRRWTWGNEPTRALVLEADPVPAVVSVLLVEIRATEYEEAKGQARKDYWHHDHEAPYPMLCTLVSAAPRGARRSSRGIPRARHGSALYRLGRLLAFEGIGPDGNYRRVKVSSAGAILAGDERTDRMHVVRTTPHARGLVPPLFILGGGYTLTERGIDR